MGRHGPGEIAAPTRLTVKFDQLGRPRGVFTFTMDARTVHRVNRLVGRNMEGWIMCRLVPGSRMRSRIANTVHIGSLVLAILAAIALSVTATFAAPITVTAKD